MTTNQTESKENIVEENVDLLTKAIGEFGKWQVYLYIVMIIPVKFVAAWTLLDIVFLAPKTTYRCVERLNSTEELLNSTCYSDCLKYEYQTEFENTIISEWGLVCGRAWLSNLSQTLCMLGGTIGGPIFGFLSDRYGRRTALLTACFLHLVAGVLVPFSPNFWVFTGLRFLLGAAAANVMVISFVIFVELVGPSKREMTNTIYHIPMALGEALMPIFSYYLRSWSKFSIGIAIPNLIFITYLWIVPESPKWLISMDRLEEASKVMKKIAKFNNLPAENMLKVAESIADANKSQLKSDSNQTKMSYVDLVKIPILRNNTAISCICWFFLAVAFYGGNQFIGQTSKNAFLAMALAGGLQIPGIILSYWLLKWIGRRNTLIWFYVICGLSNACLALPETEVFYYVRLAAGSISIACAGAAYGAIYIFTSEMFPTVARNMAMGACSTTARVGSMLAPFVAGLSVTAYWIPPTIFAAVPILAAIGTACLSETKGKKMADYV